MRRVSWTWAVCGAFAVMGPAAMIGAAGEGSGDEPRDRADDRPSIHRTAYQRGRTNRGLSARWIGQDRQDRTAPGPCVGPDGLQDARIHLTGLSEKSPVKAIRVETPTGQRWEFGLNPQLLNNADFVKDEKDGRQGDLFVQPERELTGQRLKVGVLYEDGSLDSVSIVAGRCDHRLRMPATPLPKIEELAMSATWLGQDGSNRARPGDVHILLGGLPTSTRLKAIAMSDTVIGSWECPLGDRAPSPHDSSTGSFAARIRPDRKTADLYFTPYRDASGDTFTVRLIGQDGRMWYGRFAGGPCDLARLAPAPEKSRASARPGDDLQALVDRNGSVVLAQGTYRLAHPLVLNRPVTVSAPDGATLVFAQDPNDAPWTTAIKVRRSNTTLEGFAVRFEGSVRWNWGVSYGPAVIGMTDNLEPGYNEMKSQVIFRNLDLEIAPADEPNKWNEALRLYRLIGATSGAIVGNKLRGGPIEFFHGPWQVVDNEFRGTPPSLYSHGFVVGHYTHDLLVRGNRLSSPPPSGKTWRFLVITGHGHLDRVERNVVEGVGGRDDDTIPWSNEPEIILTEGYSLRYEGKVLAASADGKVVRVGRPQWTELQPGDGVAILNGPAAGQWRRVAQVLDPTTVLLDRSIPKESDIISIAQGFISETFEGNRIDIRGGRRSACIILPGNHFGTRVADNHLLGGGWGWRMQAYPTEHPSIWGWSHTPFMGAVFERNILEDCEKAGDLGVEHTAAIKTNKGRTYMSVELRDNVVRWSEPFLAQWARSGAKEPPTGLVVGYRPSADPDELIVAAGGNALDAPRGYRDLAGMVVNGARFNSQRVVDRKFRLPAPKASGGDGRRDARSGGGRAVR